MNYADQKKCIFFFAMNISGKLYGYVLFIQKILCTTTTNTIPLTNRKSKEKYKSKENTLRTISFYCSSSTTCHKQNYYDTSL